MIERAVVLLSGGIDSATTLAIARAEGFATCALSFNYRQRHEVELDAAARIATAQRTARHLVVDVPSGLFGGSALTDPDIDLPGTPAERIDATYVPARNTVFLSLALAWAETLRAAHIFIGVSADDYAGYPDCRPEYLSAFQRMASLATAASPIEIHAPLVTLTKAEIIGRGLDLGVDYSLTRSCYEPPPGPCGHCGACILRARAFSELRLPDPAMPGSQR